MLYGCQANKKDAFKGKRRKFISRGLKGLGITKTTEHTEKIVIMGDFEEKFKWLFILEIVTHCVVNEIGYNGHTFALKF